MMTAPVASGSTADGDHTAEDKPDANEEETEEPDGEPAGDKGDEGTSGKPEGDTPENGGEAEPAPENPSKDQTTEAASRKQRIRRSRLSPKL